MKHLSEPRLARILDGGDTAPEEAAHLRGCASCRGEVAALRALERELREAPALPNALRRATLERLGLTAAPRPRAAALRWAGFLAGALVLAWILPPPPPISAPEAPLRPRLHAVSAGPARPALVLALSRPRRVKRAGGGRQIPAEIRLAGPAPMRETAVLPAMKAPAPAAPRPAAVGSSPAGEGGGAATPKGVVAAAAGPAPQPAPLNLVSVRGNLIHPGQGSVLSFTISLGQSGPVQVLALDSRGRPAATLYQGVAGPGSLDLSWDGDPAPSGTYTILIRAGGSFKTFKALVVR